MKFPKPIEWLINFFDTPISPDFRSPEVRAIIDSIKEEKFDERPYVEIDAREKIFGTSCGICSGRVRSHNGVLLSRHYARDFIVFPPSEYREGPSFYYEQILENQVVHNGCLTLAKNGEFD